MTAANTPGYDSGRTTLRNACAFVAYRSFAASISRLSIRSSATYSGSAVNGMKLYDSPAIIATGRLQDAEPVRQQADVLERARTASPLSARMKFHITVRMMNETKNGTRISRNSVAFHRPA